MARYKDSFTFFTREVKWEEAEQQKILRFCVKRNDKNLETGSLIRKRIVSVFRAANFLSDRISYTVIRCRSREYVGRN
jgi:hypothetical protein